MTPEDRLQKLGLTLPTAPSPVAAYVPAVRTGNLLYVSGQLPFRDGQLLHPGRVPDQVSVESAVLAARVAALNAIAVVAGQLDKGLSEVRRIVRLGVFVQSEPGFGDQPKVANGASELVLEVFGDAGRHARAAVGSVALPLNTCVEIELIAEVL